MSSYLKINRLLIMDLFFSDNYNHLEILGNGDSVVVLNF